MVKNVNGGVVKLNLKQRFCGFRGHNSELSWVYDNKANRYLSVQLVCQDCGYKTKSFHLPEPKEDPNGSMTSTCTIGKEAEVVAELIRVMTEEVRPMLSQHDHRPIRELIKETHNRLWEDGKLPIKRHTELDNEWIVGYKLSTSASHHSAMPIIRTQFHKPFNANQTELTVTKWR